MPVPSSVVTKSSARIGSRPARGPGRRRSDPRSRRSAPPARSPENRSSDLRPLAEHRLRRGPPRAQTSHPRPAPARTSPCGETATATLPGSVHGVVVHTSSSSSPARATAQLQEHARVDHVLVAERHLVRGQRRLAARAVRHDLVPLIQQPPLGRSARAPTTPTRCSSRPACGRRRRGRARSRSARSGGSTPPGT